MSTSKDQQQGRADIPSVPLVDKEDGACRQCLAYTEEIRKLNHLLNSAQETIASQEERLSKVAESNTKWIDKFNDLTAEFEAINTGLKQELEKSKKETADLKSELEQCDVRTVNLKLELEKANTKILEGETKLKEMVTGARQVYSMWKNGAINRRKELGKATKETPGTSTGDSAGVNFMKESAEGSIHCNQDRERLEASPLVGPSQVGPTLSDSAHPGPTAADAVEKMSSTTSPSLKRQRLNDVILNELDSFVDACLTQPLEMELDSSDDEKAVDEAMDSADAQVDEPSSFDEFVNSSEGEASTMSSEINDSEHVKVEEVGFEEAQKNRMELKVCYVRLLKLSKASVKKYLKKEYE